MTVKIPVEDYSSRLRLGLGLMEVAKQKTEQALREGTMEQTELTAVLAVIEPLLILLGS